MRRGKRVLLSLVLLVVVLVGALWVFQRRLVYLPYGVPPPVDDVLPGAEAVTVTTSDGLELGAWFLESGSTAVAFFPGNAGNRSFRAPLARALADEGLSVLLLDYRGYGGNPGRPSEEGLVDDAHAAAVWLAERPGINAVVYFGESLGAAVAIAVATDRPPAALVLRSPFSSLLEVARAHYGPVPRWFLRDRFPAVDQVASLDVPVLVVAGERDRIIPLVHSRRLYEAASEPKRFVAVPDAGHNDPVLLDGPDLLDAVTTFLRDLELLPRD